MDLVAGTKKKKKRCPDVIKEKIVVIITFSQFKERQNNCMPSAAM